jgi:hypothetical protein
MPTHPFTSDDSLLDGSLCAAAAPRALHARRRLAAQDGASGLQRHSLPFLTPSLRAGHRQSTEASLAQTRLLSADGKDPPRRWY